jgi:hypothetical protein
MFNIFNVDADGERQGNEDGIDSLAYANADGYVSFPAQREYLIMLVMLIVSVLMSVF